MSGATGASKAAMSAIAIVPPSTAPIVNSRQSREEIFVFAKHLTRSVKESEVVDIFRVEDDATDGERMDPGKPCGNESIGMYCRLKRTPGVPPLLIPPTI